MVIPSLSMVLFGCFTGQRLLEPSQIDGIFRADERPFVRRHPVEKKSPHSRSDKADGGPLLLPTAQPIPAIADVPATEVPKHDSDNTFLTGVDIVDEPPPDQAAHATTAPVVSELALPTAPEPVHRGLFSRCFSPTKSWS